MRRFISRFILILIVMVSPSPLLAEEYVIFEAVDQGEGLSNRAVSSIVKDSKGFLWFGTQGGLNRYDGYSFKVYKKKPFDSNSLSHDLVQTLHMAADDVLWIGTYQGLNRFDLKNEKFTRYRHIPGDTSSLSNDVVVSILQDGKDRLWVGTLNGLNLFDSESGTFKHYYHDPEQPNSLSNNTVRSLHEDRKGRIWVGTYGGLNQYREESDDFVAYRHDKQDPSTIASDNVMSIAQNQAGELWLGTWGGGGLSKFDIQSGEAINFTLEDNRSYVLNVQDERYVYVGTWGGGLISFDRRQGSSVQYKHSTHAAGSISHDIVYSLFLDESGVLWVGTNGGGINKMKRPDNEFSYWENDPDDPASLSAGKVTAVAEDFKSQLWIGTYNGGLNRYDPQNGRMIRYRHDPETAGTLSNDIVTSIYEDSRQNLWVTTNDGLNRYTRHTDSFERCFGLDAEISLPGQIVYAVTEDFDGSLWFGTYNNGLMHYDPESGEASYFSHDPDDPESLSDNLIYEIYLDSYNNLWVGTNNGLNLFERSEESFRRFFHDENDLTSLTSNTVRDIFEDSSRRLWIGTVSGGINLLDRENFEFSHYMRQDGMPSNTVYGMLEDYRGRLWISTMSQLTLFEPDSEEFQVVDEDNGVRAKEFARGHYSAAMNTELYFGTSDGLYKISPGDFSRNTHIPPVQLTAFRVFDKEVEFDTSLQEVDEIEVLYQDKFISFEFSALDFMSPEKNRYAYKLEGFDEDWIHSGNRRYASYTNLPPGHYTFRVKASNNDGIWNESGLSIKLEVIPPFWRTSAAYFVYVIAGFSLLYLLVQRFKKRQERAFKIKTQEMERQRLEELETEIDERRRIERELIQAKEEAESANKSKSDFIANISHEIRTPMNAIIGYSYLIRKETEDPTIHNFLSVIKRSGNQLLNLINDLLDLSAIEAGKMRVNKVPMRIDELVQDVYSTYSYRIQERGIRFESSIEEDTPEVIEADLHRLRQILFNLVGNAVKFTKNGKISVHVAGKASDAESGDRWAELYFKVSDTGMGIAPEEVSKIFQAFTQQTGQAEKYGGTGLGLTISRRLTEAMGGRISVESEVGKGSVFTVYFPKMKILDSSFRKSETQSSVELHPEKQSGQSSIEDSRVFSGEASRREEAAVWLEEEAYPWWNRISASLFIDDWREFATAVGEKGVEFGAPDLLWYGEQLDKHIATFSISSLREVVLLFPSLAKAFQAPSGSNES